MMTLKMLLLTLHLLRLKKKASGKSRWQAAQSAKMMGKLSAEWKDLSVFTQAKVNWKDVMQRFLVKQRTDQRTWADKQKVLVTVCLPSVSGEALGELYAIDTSGSIGQKELTQFASEIVKVHQDLSPIRYTLSTLLFSSVSLRLL